MSTIPSYCGSCLHWMFHHKAGAGCIVDDCTCGREPTSADSPGPSDSSFAGAIPPSPEEVERVRTHFDATRPDGGPDAG